MTRPDDVRDERTASEPLHGIEGELDQHLTVVYGQAQLLRRRLEQGRIKDAYECLQAITSIERSAAAMRTYLHSADTPRPSHRPRKEDQDPST